MAIGKRVSQLTADDFSGGCNYSSDLTALQLNESPNAINIEFFKDRIRKRSGYEVLADAGVADGYGHAIINFGVTSAGQKQVLHIKDTVYAMDSLSGTLSSIRTGIADTRSYFSRVSSYLIQTYQNAAPYYWDGLATSMSALSGSAPSFKRAIEFQGFLLGMSTPTDKMRVYYQPISTMVGGAFSSYFTLAPAPNDDYISEPFLLNGRCYIGSRYSIFRVSYVGGVTQFEYKQVITDVGIVENTVQIVVTPEFGQVAVFMGYDRQMYVFDGANVKTISDKYFSANNDTDIAMEYLDESYKENAYSAFDTVNQVYRLVVTQTGEQTNRFMININMEGFTYYPYDNMVFHSIAQCTDQVGRRFLIGLGYDGKVYKMFTRVNHDAGQAIIEYYESPIFRYRDNSISQGRSLLLYFSPVANYKLQMTERVDFDKTWRVRASVPMFHSRDHFLGYSGALGGDAVLGSDVEMLVQSVDVKAAFSNYRFRLESGAGDVCSYTTGTVAGSGGGTTVTGTGTAWTSDMTAANGWRIWIKDGVHKNETYSFTYTSATGATVSTMAGTSPTNDFTGASYEVYRTSCGACMAAWELNKIHFDAAVLSVGNSEPKR